MAERQNLYYPEELVPVVDDVLVNFAENLAADKSLQPVEFTQRMLGAMSLARRLKDFFIVKDGGNNG